MSGMIKCPGCEDRLPEDDLQAQREHMEQFHPEIIAKRLEDADFRQIDGKWVDTLVTDE